MDALARAEVDVRILTAPRFLPEPKILPAPVGDSPSDPACAEGERRPGRSGSVLIRFRVAGSMASEPERGTALGLEYGHG